MTKSQAPAGCTPVVPARFRGDCRVLFVCARLGGRSRIAELYAQAAAGDRCVFRSSCYERGSLPRSLVELMAEVQLDLPPSCPPSVFERHDAGERFDYVVLICDDREGDLQATVRDLLETLFGGEDGAWIHTWSIPDFATLGGPIESHLDEARGLRDQIHRHVRELLRVLAGEVQGRARQRPDRPQ